MWNPFKRRKGLLIAIEGIDGAGKTTQMKMLVRWLQNNLSPDSDIECLGNSFPNYSTESGIKIRGYLNGNINLSPKEAAELYAQNKIESANVYNFLLRQGNILVIDRYVTSNLAYQTARVSKEKRNNFRKWLSDLEYKKNKIPRPDIVIQLKPDVATARKRVSERSELDAYEEDFLFQTEVANEYDVLAKKFGKNWLTVTVCPNDSPDDIHLWVKYNLINNGVFKYKHIPYDGWKLSLSFWRFW